MLDLALESGVRMVAPTISREIMGVNREEVVDGIEAGGVAAMLEAADTDRATWFV